jgi:hypothetical protein
LIRISKTFPELSFSFILLSTFVLFLYVLSISGSDSVLLIQWRPLLWKATTKQKNLIREMYIHIEIDEVEIESRKNVQNITKIFRRWFNVRVLNSLPIL